MFRAAAGVSAGVFPKRAAISRGEWARTGQYKAATSGRRSRPEAVGTPLGLWENAWGHLRRSALPQIHPRPHSAPRPRPSRSPSSSVAISPGGELAVFSLPDRRWPLWIARLVLLALVAGAGLLLKPAMADAGSRELFVMSVLATAATAAVFFIWAHETINRAKKQPRTRVMKAAMTAAASCVSIWVFLIGTQADATHVRTKARHTCRLLPGVLDDAAGLAIHDDHVASLPRFSARMTGALQAPVGLVFLGSGHALLETFTEAGWHVAERITLQSALRAFGRGVLNRPYHSAPVFPSFLEGNLHDVAFQQTTPGGSSRRRHHARWWLTDFTCEGKQVWVATASYDAGVGVGRLLPVPIHHIDPDIDAERDYIVRSLMATGKVRTTQEVRVTEPMVGRNAAGDRFYTRGKAFVLA